MRLFIIHIVALLGLTFHGYSQLVVKPLQGDPSRKHVKKTVPKVTPLLKTTAVGDTVPLPFFDDFSLSEKTPDPALWEGDGGTYINNRFCLRPPTFNVATFDGMKSDGSRYSLDFDDVGICDSLTSKPIYLDYAQTDSAYLSFFWQRGGLGEVPDSSIFEVDSLTLQFKDSLGNWRSVWRQFDGQTDTFFYEIIYITDTFYLYDGFQFRFKSYGRQAGNYDIWNVDYIHLDTNTTYRLEKPDVALSISPSPLLSRYTAMPWEQYFANKNTETSDTLSVTINNFYANPVVITDFQGSALIDTISGDTLDRFAPGDMSFSNNPLTPFQQQGSVYYTVQKDSIVSKGQPMVIESLFLSRSPDDNTSIPPIDFRRNDTLSSYTVLDNYFAYDDGSAEFGITIQNQPFAQAAQRFQLNTSDTLSHIDFHFPQMGEDATGEPFGIRVWKVLEDIDGTSDNLLTTQTIALAYSDSINKFIRYQLIEPQIINGTFYVGWQSQSNTEIPIGFDKNNDASAEIFFNLNGSGWVPYSGESGAIMIRPVFEEGVVLTGINEEEVTINAKLYPNPTSGEITIEGEATEIIVRDINGREVYSSLISTNKTQIDLSHLPNGFYITRLKNNKGSKTIKLIINSNK